MKRPYHYSGPVMRFDQCIQTNWEGYTLADSEKKARSNLVYNYKRVNGLLPSAKITLPGPIRIVQ